MKKFFYTLLIGLLCVMNSTAQNAEPLHWTVQQEGDQLTLTATIDEGWHLTVKGNYVVADVEENELQLTADSEPLEEYDDIFEEMVYFYEQTVSFSGSCAGVKGQAQVKCQVCNDMTCKQVVYPFEIGQSTEQISAATATQNPAPASLWWVFIMGLLGGLLAIFTPCVWPLIPMTVSFFIKRASGWKSAALYGLSIILIYVGLGLLITVIFGASALNALSTNAVVNLIFFALLVVFAISFFGAFEITLPSSWSTKLDTKARSTTGVLSLLFMAFVLVLVSFSCTGPIIGTLLVEAAGHSLLAPAIGMLGFSIALALPFTLFALFPNALKKMPKSGSWMNRLKVVLAFLELALSLKFLSAADLAYGWHILDRETFIALWVAIFSLLGFYLLGWISFPHDDKKEKVTVTGFMLAVVSISFAIYLLPGLWGAPLKAASGFVPPMNTQDFCLTPAVRDDVVNVDDLYKTKSYEDLLKLSEQTGKTLIIDFTGHACQNCRKLEAKVLADKNVQIALKNYVIVPVYVDDKTKLPEVKEVQENGKSLKLKTIGDYWSYVQRSRFNANAQPYLVPLSSDGKLLKQPYGYDDSPEKFIQWLQQ